ncbi:glycosyltransferase family 2 protein [Algibacter sp. PT7-4]|uniref:glycosyltransferase family 2 protein n=1 Tax=Algibacter ulvanivorans TaxID=3400999 RepID=UPI003AAA542A
MDNKANILVSIIVPCYKQAHFLNESLQSVLNQIYTNWECIIVNDGSPDNTEEITKTWLNKDNRFKYLYKENGGLSSARNAGVKISKGTYILPLDADDILHESYLLKLVPVLEEESSLAIVSTYSKFFKKHISKTFYELKPNGSTHKNLLYANQLSATSLYRKVCWEQVGGYDESMRKGFEDWEFWLAITKRGWSYKIIEEFLFYYRKSKQSMLVDTIKHHSETNRAYIFKKHKELYIEDFENCMSVMFFELNRARTKEIKLKNSLEYKLAKLIAKPFKAFKK